MLLVSAETELNGGPTIVIDWFGLEALLVLLHSTYLKHHIGVNYLLSIARFGQVLSTNYLKKHTCK